MNTLRVDAGEVPGTGSIFPIVQWNIATSGRNLCAHILIILKAEERELRCFQFVIKLRAGQDSEERAERESLG